MKNFIPQVISGVFEIELFHVEDERGLFVKPLHAPTLIENGLEHSFPESFFSVNKKGVIRGMHFQLPPHDHAKIVYCTSGSVLDVIVDLRKSSKTFGQFCTIELSSKLKNAAYLPRGVAHGFCTLEDNACMFYHTSTVHAPSHDSGIRFDSFGFEWPFKQALHSPRDLELPKLANFNSPFD